MADPWAEFRKSDPWADFRVSAESREPANNAGMSRFDDISATEAYGRGFTKAGSFGFRDELAGLAAAGGAVPEENPDPAALLGQIARGAYRKFTGDADAQRRYEEEVRLQRAENERVAEAHPTADIAGQVTGAIAMPFGALRAPTLLGRMGQGAAIGGVYGALSGAGEAEEGNRLSGAATGGATGALLGGASVPVVEGLAKGAGAALSYPINMVRSAVNPTGAAERAVARAGAEAAEADPQALARLTAADIGSGPGVVMDTLGVPGQRLARSASNLSAEARTTLDQTLEPRFAGQSPRLSEWLDRQFGFPNAEAQQAALAATAKSANSQAYKKAYEEGGNKLWSDELQRLADSDAVDAAMKKAVKSSRDEAILRGETPPEGGTPNLAFWDQVRRELSDAAKRAGYGTEESKRLNGFATQLNSILDNMVPSYKQARATAAGFFGARDALEAGEKFFGQRFENEAARKALAKMSPTERQLFQDGFVSRMKQAIEAVPDRRNITTVISQSPALKEKLQIALGRQGARELEAVFRLESIFEQSRRAVVGNSTTAQQLTTLGLAGGGAGAGYYFGFDPTTSGIATFVGAMTKKGIDKRVADRIAKMLVSKDPKLVQRAITQLASKKVTREALRAAEAAVARLGGMAGAGMSQ